MTKERKILAKKWEAFFEEQLKEKGYLRTPFVVSFIQDEMPPEIVICAAVKTRSGKVFRGNRHGDAIHAAQNAGWTIQDLSFADQGFVTSKNRYVTREEGRQLQDAAGIKSASPEGYMPGTLFSEDLY